MTDQIPEREALPSYHSDALDSMVHPSHVTLIIAPSPILGQWRDEIARHAPSLRVCVYTGVKQFNATSFDARTFSREHDVVLTTYDVLRREVAIARRPHARAMRRPADQRRTYRRPLLVQLEFLRVVMDEAQMIGETVSAVSETASLIPRRYSWAVTSTPLKGQVGDVQGLLAFLRVEPLVGGGAPRSMLTNLLSDTKLFAKSELQSAVWHLMIRTRSHFADWLSLARVGREDVKGAHRARVGHSRTKALRRSSRVWASREVSFSAGVCAAPAGEGLGLTARLLRPAGTGTIHVTPRC